MCCVHVCVCFCLFWIISMLFSAMYVCIKTGTNIIRQSIYSYKLVMIHSWILVFFLSFFSSMCVFSCVCVCLIFLVYFQAVWLWIIFFPLLRTQTYTLLVRIKNSGFWMILVLKFCVAAVARKKITLKLYSFFFSNFVMISGFFSNDIQQFVSNFSNSHHVIVTVFFLFLFSFAHLAMIQFIDHRNLST